MKLSEKAIRMIGQVLVVNDDICRLFEQRGVSRDEVKEILRLAEVGRLAEETQEGN